MQAMSVMFSAIREAMTLDGDLKLGLIEYPDMPAGLKGIAIGWGRQFPAKPFRASAGHARSENAIGFQNAPDLGEYLMKRSASKGRASALPRMKIALLLVLPDFRSARPSRAF